MSWFFERARIFPYLVLKLWQKLSDARDNIDGHLNRMNAGSNSAWDLGRWDSGNCSGAYAIISHLREGVRAESFVDSFKVFLYHII